MSEIEPFPSERKTCDQTPKSRHSVVLSLCLSGLALTVAEGVTMQPASASIPWQIAQAPANQASDYAVLFVNPLAGSDSSNGSEQAPLKTITQALRLVQPNTIIVLAAGTYSAETGEIFPLYLKPGTTIKGEPRDRGLSTVIKGGGAFLSRTFARQNVTIVGANQAGLTGVTISNPAPQGYGLWVESTSPVVTDNTFTGSDHDGVSVVGSSAPILRNNYFYQNGANGITIYGTSRPELQDNIFEKTGFGINIAQNSAPRLVGNRVTQNKDGIVIQGKAQPILRGNVVDSNDRDGIVAIGQSRPNLGTSADPGNNTFMGNRQLDINAKTSSETIAVFGNQLASNKANGKLDFLGTTSVADIPVAPPISVAAVSYGRTLSRAQPPAQSLNRETTASDQTMPTISIPVPAPTRRLARLPVGTLFSAPNPSRPAATSARRLPAPKDIAASPAQIQVAPPMISPVQTVSPIRPALSRRPISEMSASQSFTGSIEIPVPAPESGAIAVAPTAPSIPSLGAASSTAISSQGVLLVPSGAAPIGNVGNGSSVPMWRGSSPSSEGSPPTPPSRLASALRYRVVVEAENDSQQAQLRAIVPDAFSVSLNGRTAMQAGAFSDRDKADQLLQVLTSQGLKATIESL